MIPTQLTELPGEDLESPSLAEVAGWITIYDELANVMRSVLARSGDRAGADALSANLAWIEDRLARWRSRHAELFGVLVDTSHHTVTYAGRTVALTARETDLLFYFTAHPDRPFTPRQLALGAWNNARLSDAQVRTYMMRLRRRLASIGLGNVIRVVKRRGYALALTDVPAQGRDWRGGAAYDGDGAETLGR